MLWKLSPQNLRVFVSSGQLLEVNKRNHSWPPPLSPAPAGKKNNKSYIFIGGRFLASSISLVTTALHVKHLNTKTKNCCQPLWINELFTVHCLWQYQPCEWFESKTPLFQMYLVDSLSMLTKTNLIDILFINLFSPTNKISSISFEKS